MFIGVLTNMEREKIMKILQEEVEKNPYMAMYPLKKEALVFEERVKINCFYCARYNTKWTCPPRIPNLNYQKVIMEYEHLMVLVYKRAFSKEDYDSVRIESTNDLHRKLLDLEKILYCNNESMAISFIGGSCKLCKNGCGKEKCNNPGRARIPWEAVGVNLIKTIENMNIGYNIQFPIKDTFYRYGLLLF